MPRPRRRFPQALGESPSAARRAGDFNAAALRAGAAPLWVGEGSCDALALLAAGVPRVVALFGVQGGRWAWAREVRELMFALDTDAAGQQQWRQLACEAALRGKQVAVLPPAAYGGHKDVNEAWIVICQIGVPRLTHSFATN